MQYLTTTEAADYLRLSEQTIRAWYRSGKLKGSKPGGRKILFEKNDLDNLINQKS